MKLRTILIIILVLFTRVVVYSQVPEKLRSTLGSSGSSNLLSLSGNHYWIQQSVGQESVIGIFNTKQGYLYQGFIQPRRSHVNDLIVPELKAIIYPNPFSTSITIEFREPLALPAIVITDMLGHVVYKNDATIVALTSIDLPKLAKGTYLLRLVNHQQQRIVKLVKE